MKLLKNDKKFINDLNNYLEKGGVVVFVTDTVWGIGCLPNSQKGVNEIYKIKNRDLSKPLILMSNSFDNLQPYISSCTKQAKNIIDKYFPGALTLVLEKSEKTPDFITSNKNTVGIRVPYNPVFSDLCSIIDGHVLATTSANYSGEPPCLTYKEAFEQFKKITPYIIEDAGSSALNIPSTVAGFEDDNIIIFRQGAVKIT